ncbi:hypothetical protein REPUB_Repub07fG0034300 [Reevesia pubescens]
MDHENVNKKYRCLEIDLDGLYKRILLLKKKKYVAVKVKFKDGMPYEPALLVTGARRNEEWTSSI